ncbi:hypothetical protein SAMN05444166_1927 [Singulisphaera sp. GP187]|uniref:hypothetical protein n=1 Tax=Singulisphaera sp. GP187 TaxID=1882752 RepID=UPI000929DDB6|nr:hypothetical protein [Singulisphaera sp. GP187]SIN98858.1 hypothetical protein SAMN05444166_1927 [Singulisphaera sp. GP187]
MPKAKFHPRLLICTIAALCVMAWVNDRVHASTHTQETNAAAVDRLQILRHEAKWQRVRFERVSDEPTLSALEEDDEQEEVRESAQSSLIVHFDRPVSTREVNTLLIPDCDFRGDSPGGRRGPPPRMPPA